MASEAPGGAATLAGLDALETALEPAPRLAIRAWRAVWPKLAAVGIAVGAWQLVILSGWRPPSVLPGPVPVFRQLLDDIASGGLAVAVAITLRRALVGYALAVLIGAAVGLAVARFRLLRNAVGSLITGLQTMPSIAWFPLAILLFQPSEGAVLFVIVLGAAPSAANGLLSGIDSIPPLLLRAGRVLGARRWTKYRYVILPAALPAFVAGLKQGWAFGWRSLIAGELLVVVARRQSIGARLQLARELADTPALLATMLAILGVGILVDGLFFGTLERRIRRRRGLADPAE